MMFLQFFIRVSASGLRLLVPLENGWGDALQAGREIYKKFRIQQYPCGSEPAREGGVTFNIIGA
jgi:hypothetical protein